MLKLENISVLYDGRVLAVDDVSLEVKQGEFVGVIGSSGSGKSTLLKAINLLVRPSKGKIYMDDMEVTGMSSTQLKNIRKSIFIYRLLG